MKKLLFVSLAAILASAGYAVTLTFNSKAHGEIVDTDYAGLTISATGGTNKAATFNSELLSTIEDYDLLRTGTWSGGNLANTTVMGNLLYVQDNQRPGTTGDIFNNPDDEVGANIIFEFDTAIGFLQFDFVDIESSEALTVTFLDGATSKGSFNVGSLSTDVEFGDNTINQTDTKDLSGLNVNRVEFDFSGSGAIDNIRYGVPDSGATIGLFGIVFGGLFVARRRCKK